MGNSWNMNNEREEIRKLNYICFSVLLKIKNNDSHVYTENTVKNIIPKCLMNEKILKLYICIFFLSMHYIQKYYIKR